MTKKILKALGLLLLVATFTFAVSPAFIATYYKKKIYTDLEFVQPEPVAIVFGAAITNNSNPSDILRDRLDIAIALYKADKVQRIHVSGDNRASDYNEPSAMENYLISQGIPEAAISRDPLGLRTFDSCKRAHEIYEIDRAILVTQGYHLIRALFTCNQVGIDSFGLSATLQPYVKEKEFKTREILAIYKAVIDIFIYEPHWQE